MFKHLIAKLTIFLAALLALAQTAPAILVETEIPASAIKLTASSVYQGQVPARLLDGSGLNGDTHDNHNYAGTMWHTTENPTVSAVAGIKAPAWVRFDFAKPQSFEKILIWNHNQAGLTDRGFRKTKILGTVDGASWLPLAELDFFETLVHFEQAESSVELNYYKRRLDQLRIGKPKSSARQKLSKLLSSAFFPAVFTKVVFLDSIFFCLNFFLERS